MGAKVVQFNTIVIYVDDVDFQSFPSEFNYIMLIDPVSPFPLHQSFTKMLLFV